MKNNDIYKDSMKLSVIGWILKYKKRWVIGHAIAAALPVVLVCVYIEDVRPNLLWAIPMCILLLIRGFAVAIDENKNTLDSYIKENSEK